MRKCFLVGGLLGAALILWLPSAPAFAQATRTWVSGVGDDANPCSRTAPCKTWAGAISKTTAGGEIDNLDAGGFGALTITKSITLDGGGGAVASTLVSGTNGINIAASQTNVAMASGATAPTRHAATCATCSESIDRTSSGTDAKTVSVSNGRAEARRSATKPATAASGTSARKSQ